MKIPHFALIPILAIASLLPVPAALAGDANVGVSVTVIALPKNEAMAFTSGHNLQQDAPGALKELVKMVTDKTADSVANPSVTTKSGQRAVSQAGETVLEVEPVLSPAGDAVDVNIALTCSKQKIITSVGLKPGESKYIGSFDAIINGKDSTCLAFLRVETAK